MVEGKVCWGAALGCDVGQGDRGYGCSRTECVAHRGWWHREENNRLCGSWDADGTVSSSGEVCSAEGGAARGSAAAGMLAPVRCCGASHSKRVKGRGIRVMQKRTVIVCCQ